MKAVRTVRQAAGFLDRVGFALLMPHRGLPMPTLWEAIRGRPGGHPFRPWTKESDLMWEWKDELPARRLAYYGAIWAGKPGFVSLSMLACLMRLWSAPLGPDGFRLSYREGMLSFDANRICEALFYGKAMNTYRLRVRVGIASSTFKRALSELQKKLIIAKCGTDDSDTTWPAEVVDLSARVFPSAHAEAGTLSFMEAREDSLATIHAHSQLTQEQAARLLRVGVDPK